MNDTVTGINETSSSTQTRGQAYSQSLNEIDKPWYKKLGIDKSYINGAITSVIMMAAGTIAYLGITQSDMPIIKKKVDKTEQIENAPTEPAAPIAPSPVLPDVLPENIPPLNSEVFIVENSATPEQIAIATEHTNRRSIADQIQEIREAVNKNASDISAIVGSINRNPEILNAPATSRNGVVLKEFSNVRSTPQIDNNSIDSLSVGEVVTVTARVGEWYQILHDGSSGYMHRSVLKIVQ